MVRYGGCLVGGWGAPWRRVLRVGVFGAAIVFAGRMGEAHNEKVGSSPDYVHSAQESVAHQHPQSEPPRSRPVPAEAEPLAGQLPIGKEVLPQEHAATPAAISHEQAEEVGDLAAAEEPAREHASSSPARWFVRFLLLLSIAVGGWLMFHARHSLRPAIALADPPGRDVLDWPVIGKLLRWRHFPTLLTAPTMVIFVFIVTAGLWGEQNSSNPAVLLTWILWWPAVIFTFFLVGRIWCVACPFGYLGDVAQKIFSCKRKVPRILKNMWWRLALFLLLTWATTLWAWDRWPRSTVWLALGLTLGAMALAFLYEKRAFCRFVCPVGGVFGLYSMTAPLRLDVKDKRFCQTQCKEKNCFQACAWFQFPGAMERNAECNLCLQCVPACPYNNLALRTQPFGGDLANFQPHRKSLDEAATVAAVLGVTLLQTLVMLQDWEAWEARVGSFLHISSGPALYTLIFATLGLLAPLLLVGLVAYLAAQGHTRRARAFAALRTYAYAFLPLGLGLHAAHNFQHLFGEGGALWTGLKAALARYTGPSAALGAGWESLAPSASIHAAAAADPNVLFLLQWLALMGGLLLAFRIATALAQRHAAERAMAFRMALPIFVFAVGYTVLNVLLLAAPMAHRH